MSAKKILIAVSGGGPARDILRSGVLDLVRGHGRRIFLAVPADKYDFYLAEFGAPDVEVRAAPALHPSFSDRALSSFARNAFATRTIVMLQETQMRLHRRYGAYLLKSGLRIFFGRSRAFHRMIRFLYRVVPPHKEYREFFAAADPDVFFAADAFGDMDVALWRAAVGAGVPCRIMVRSWDNLSNHGLLRMVPDALIVHSPFIKNLAREGHYIPEKNIIMTGIPHYDWYLHGELFESREDFCRRIGADGAKKLILFAGIGDFLSPHEWEGVKILSDEMSAGNVHAPAEILFRPHPNFLTQREKISALPGVIFDNHVARYTGSDTSTMEMGRDEMAHLINSLRHADVVVTTASSITIDAAAFDRPVVCIAFDGESREPHWNSVARFYTDFTHYKIISETKGFKIAHSPSELVAGINAYLKDPAEDSGGREKIRNDFIWRLDGRSCERIAEVILAPLVPKKL